MHTILRQVTSAHNTQTSDEYTQHCDKWRVHTTLRQVKRAHNTETISECTQHRQVTSAHNTETGDERTQDKSSTSVYVLHIGWVDYTPFDTSYVQSQSLYWILLLSQMQPRSNIHVLASSVFIHKNVSNSKTDYTTASVMFRTT